MQILIVEDDEKIANVLRKGLLEERYSVTLAHDGEKALEQFEINEYDLVILDLMIPKISGQEVCRQIRDISVSVPILVLTARDSTEDKVHLLDVGADDYMTKPFAFEEFSARVRALIRRSKKADAAILSLDNLTLNPATRIVSRGSEQINLTPREYALLDYFMRNQNMLLTKTQILEHVWDYDYDGFSNIIETYIKYLRKKLQVTSHEKPLIHTRRGSGYVFTVGK